MREPGLWFDTIKHPAIDLGLFVLPAYVVPVTLALLLPALQQLERQLHRRLAEYHVEDHAEQDKSEKRGPDLEKDGNDSRAKTPIKNRSWLKQVPKYVLWMIHQQWTVRVLSSPGSLKDSFDGFITILSLTHVVAMALTTEFYGVDRRAGAVTAAGWLLLAALDPPTTPAAVLIAVLALPYVFQSGSPRHVLAPSGTLLVALMCDTLLPRDSTLRLVTIRDVELWPVGVAALLALSKAGFRLLRASNLSTPSGLATLASRAKAEASEGLFCAFVGVGVCLGILGPMAICGILACFCFSCFGWRWLYNGIPASSPSAATGILAVFPYMLAWYCVSRKPLGPSNGKEPYWLVYAEMVAPSVLALGWTSACLTLLWLALLGFRVVYPQPTRFCEPCQSA